MRAVITELALALGEGESTQHIACPECGGGSSKEKSFVVTRESGKVLYKCFRASCGLAGVIDSITSPPQSTAKKKSLRPYTGATRPLAGQELDYAKARWGLSCEELEAQGVSVDAQSGRVVFPCYTREGWCWGHQLRSIDGKHRKASLYWHSEYPERLHFPKASFQGDTVIIVEDIPSAIKGKTLWLRGINFSSLLGTHVALKQAILLSLSYKKAILALDKDATNKSIQHKKKYSIMFDRLDIVPLDKDIKNMSDEELAKFKEYVDDLNI